MDVNASSFHTATCYVHARVTFLNQWHVSHVSPNGISEYSQFWAKMRNAQAGPSMDEGCLDGESGDMVRTRAGPNVSPFKFVARVPPGVELGTIVLVEAINK